MNTLNGLKTFVGLVLAVAMCFAVGCGGAKPEYSADSSELEAFLEANPESANMDLEPPADPTL